MSAADSDYAYGDVDVLPPPPRLTADQVAAARRTVAARSTSVDDCRELLAMLGLDDNR